MSIGLTEINFGGMFYSINESEVTLKEDVLKGSFRVYKESFATDIAETWKPGAVIGLVSTDDDGVSTTFPKLLVKRGSLMSTFIYQPLGKSYTLFDFTWIITNPIVNLSVEEMLESVIEVFK